MDAELAKVGARLLEMSRDRFETFHERQPGWGLFGRVVEAMREKEWWVSHFQATAVGWVVELSDKPIENHDLCPAPGQDANPAIAALKAAKAALGGDDGAQ